MAILHQTGREMSIRDTDSRHNRIGNTTHNHHRAIVVLAISNPCVVTFLIRHTMSLQCPGKSYLHKSSRLIPTKRKLGNPLVAPHK
jgi:hypothetical protein